MTPFWANYNYHPTEQFKSAKNLSRVADITEHVTRGKMTSLEV